MAAQAKKRISAKERARIGEILARLDAQYGTDVGPHLQYQNPFQLLVATILSAQCTDARVNMVTPALFEKYPDAKAFAKAKLKDLEKMIHSTGFYHNKAKNLIACGKMLTEEFGGEVPSDIDLLTTLPGVGRKTANVIRGNIFHTPSIVVDTHVGRISRRLGLTKETDPEKVEYDLMRTLPEENWIRYNIQIISFGRAVCKAPKAKCADCFLTDLCPSFQKPAATKGA